MPRRKLSDRTVCNIPPRTAMLDGEELVKIASKNNVGPTGLRIEDRLSIHGIQFGSASKILNREAAQKARDRKKDSIKMMEQCIAQLRSENRFLRRTNVALKEKCRDHEQKFISLRRELDALIQSLRTGNRKQIEPSESAVLTPQQQGVALCLLVFLFLPLLADSEFFLPELATIEVSSEVTIPPSETPEADAHEIDIAPIVPSSSVYDLIYQSFCDSEANSDVILSPSSTSDESLDDILQCLEADGYCSDALDSTIPSLTPEYSFIDAP
ncbi:unnamed protein product [Dibothriocephalus latus]|uniref:BZIP domain-containing protein n=1 Tax=Dibothriocephalus latus TaxID=60516 RepID=A0A3P7LHD1_DIBLA|nr:unnamed protein product [Dibothriocephalus latus]